MVHNPIRNSEEDLKENILYYYVSSLLISFDINNDRDLGCLLLSLLLRQ